MNLIGVFMWVAIGATALHYWNGYMAEHKYVSMNSERMVRTKIIKNDLLDRRLFFRLV